MTQEDILRMARQAGVYTSPRYPDNLLMDVYDLERFTIFVAAAQREKVAAWMRSLGYATGHGDTIEALLDHLGTQIAQGLEAEVLMEREACAKVCEAEYEGYDWADRERDGAEACAAAIRARRNK
jgi:hypothetical protein